MYWLKCLALFTVLAGAVYFPVFTGHVPFPKDIVLQFPAWAEVPRTAETRTYAEIGDLVTFCYPFRQLLADSIRDGALPLWNPYFLSGESFIANSQSSLFYPLNIFYYVLPLPAAWAVSLILRRILAALFMTLFVRSIGGSGAGAVLAGIVYSCCAFTTVWQGQAAGDAAIWLPLMCYAVHRLRQALSPRTVSITAFVFAMPVLAGHPETALNMTLAGVALAAVLWLLPGEADRRALNPKFFALFAIAGILAIGLASIQMIPTLEWISQIGDNLDEVWPANETGQLKGLVSRDILRNPSSSGISIPEAASYAGIISLLAAFIAPLHHARRYVRFLIVITVISAAIAFSIEPLRWLVAHTPFFKALRNGRLILVTNFGIAALAGLGLSALDRDELPAAFKRNRLRLLLALGFGTIAFLLYTPLQASVTTPADITRTPAASFLLLVGGLVLIEMHLRGWLRRQAFATFVIGIAALDLATFSYGYTGFARPSEIFPKTAVFDFLKKQTGPGEFRIAQAGYPYTMNAGVMYGIESMDGYQISTDRTRNLLLDFAENRLDGIFLLTEKLLRNEDSRIDMMNTKYFVVPRNGADFNAFSQRSDRFSVVFDDKQVAVFENRHVLPRAFLVPASGVELIPESAAQLARIKDRGFDPRSSVILSRMPSTMANPSSAEASLESDVELVDRNTSSYRFRVRSPQAAILVLSQMHDAGWTASIDGSATDTFEANYALTGITILPGDHDVRFAFRPRSLAIGALVSIASLAILAVLSRGLIA